MTGSRTETAKLEALTRDLALNVMLCTDSEEAIRLVEAFVRALSVSRPAVKGLEWKAEDIGCTAQTDLGEWAVDHDDDEDVAGTPWSAWGPQESIGHFSTEEAAKAAAQSDFEQRILSSLSPPTGGWQLVPIEPTTEMWAKAGDALVKLQAKGIGHHDKLAEATWTAMLSAITKRDGQ